MSPGGAQPEQERVGDSGVMDVRVTHAEKEISEHGRRVGRIEQQLHDLALSVTKLVESNEASRRFTAGVLKVLGVVAAGLSVGITVLFNLLGRHP